MKRTVVKSVMAMILTGSLVFAAGCASQESNTQSSTGNANTAATTATAIATSAATAEPVAEASEAVESEAAADEDEDKVYAKFKDMMDEVYGINPGSSGTSLRAEAASKKLVDFAMKYGSGSTSSVFSGYAEKWAKETLKDCSKANLEIVEESLDMAEDYAEDNDKSIETDVAFLNVINGIENYLDPEIDD